MDFTSYLAEKLGDHVLNAVAYPSPTVFMGFGEGAGFGKLGDLGNEATYLNYARQPIPAMTYTGPSPAPDVFENSADVTFGANQGVQVTLTAIGLWDALTLGNLLFWENLGTPIVLEPIQLVRYAAGNLTVEFD